MFPRNILSEEDLKNLNKYFGVGDCYEKGIMKERAIIPIHNVDGQKLVGVIARSIKEYNAKATVPQRV